MVYHFTMRMRLPLLFFCIALFVTACSTNFLYNQLDRLIVWRVGGFVTLTSEQKLELRNQLQARLDDVRINEFPRLAAEIQSASATIAANEVSAQTVEATYQRMVSLWDELLVGVVPIAANTLMSLSADQKLELFDNLTELNDEMYEKYSGTTPEERRKNRNKSTIQALEGYAGSLNSIQEELVDDALGSMADASEQWIEYQREWQQRFITLLKENPPQSEFVERLEELLVYPRNFHTDEYRQRVDANRQIMNLLTVDLIASLTKKQRQRVIVKLDGYVERLTALSNYR